MLLVGNGRVITQNAAKPLIENGCVAIDGNKIVEVGSYNELKSKYKDAEFIDAKGKVIMPGLINAHHHIYSSFARGMALDGEPGANFIGILEKLWWRLDKKLTLEDTKYSAYSTLIDCIKNGVTTVFDHHASPFAAKDSLFTIGEVSKELGIRSSLCYEVSDRDGEAVLREGIEENVNFIKYANTDEQDMLKGMFGLHASFTLSDKSLNECKEAMEGLNAGYHVHTAEGIDDLYDSLNKYGKRVVQRLLDFDILGDKSIAVHCIHTNGMEMDILKATKTNVVHNPESNMGNAVGCSPVIEMMRRGIKVGLGTDGYTSDMFESMKVANIIHKHQLCDPRVAWGEVPQMLFENNRDIAKAYFSKPVGVLEAGAYADVIVVDYNPHTPMTETNINGHILFGMTGRCVDTTIVNGKILMKNRELLIIDEERIISKSREVAEKLWKRV
ncbi:putative aminohydrolase SsnA [Clostridium swellfunianum]|uniref:putative aminohydrolase SsnA n=1 Tax=Clostridium swellfunianum TaxID=1367462 RepID=UPI00202E1B39|nr:putative aminohydrolase SsnA [Clostridium swellfunianum]MCM0648210.1 putative aminohydrolase SsnA [Clostridium swellfunianum]